MAKVLVSGHEVKKFELQFRYYVRFLKGIESPYPPSYGLNS